METKYITERIKNANIQFFEETQNQQICGKTKEGEKEIQPRLEREKNDVITDILKR